MFNNISNYFTILKNYLTYIFFGDENENNLKEIYLENNLDLSKIYVQLGKINKLLVKEKDFEKILNFLNRQLKYEEELINYEKVLDLELEIKDKVKRIELITNLNSSIASFEKLKKIKEEYYRNNPKDKNN